MQCNSTIILSYRKFFVKKVAYSLPSITAILWIRDKLILSVATILLWMTGFGYTINMISRLSNYFLIIMVIEFPNALYKRKVDYSNFIRLMFSIIFIAYFFAELILRPEWNCITPYRFFAF